MGLQLRLAGNLWNIDLIGSRTSSNCRTHALAPGAGVAGLHSLHPIAPPPGASIRDVGTGGGRDKDHIEGAAVVALLQLVARGIIDTAPM